MKNTEIDFREKFDYLMANPAEMRLFLLNPENSDLITDEQFSQAVDMLRVL
ncbi:hypothetical protein ACLI1A_11615 [Flavobacterium sp. RHBU_3]|uniref:hypothetical protein n=1 Tax=Flavobacterium sp. RHBU_3 TaxID=3391184 RepID=UPI0039851DE5